MGSLFIRLLGHFCLVSPWMHGGLLDPVFFWIIWILIGLPGQWAHIIETSGPKFDMGIPFVTIGCLGMLGGRCQKPMELLEAELAFLM